MEKWEEVPLTQSQIANNMTTLMQNKLAPLGSSSCAGRWKPCIFSIPEYYRMDNKDIYRPFSASIGPAYFKDSTLETLQEAKWIFLNLFLQHPKNAYPNNLKHYVEFVRERELKIRMCYDEILLRRNPISNEEFIQMIILDATFIISSFLGVIGELENPNLPDNVSPLLENYFEKDIFLMENQLPFFILHELFDTSFGSAFHKSFIEIACECMCESYFFRTKDSMRYSIIGSDDLTSSKHLLDLYYRIFCLHEVDFNRQKKEIAFYDENMRFFSLKDLLAAGVYIVTTERQQVIHIEYENGVLKMPKIVIDDNTESQLRNLLYFEQCHSPDKYIAAYVSFFNKLITTAEDVQSLIDNRILIYKGLGSNEAVANLFNNLTKHISVEDSAYYYWDISRELNAYGSIRWHGWKRVLKIQYFNSPWSIISVVAAGILFILTLLQTIAAFI